MLNTDEQSGSGNGFASVRGVALTRDKERDDRKFFEALHYFALQISRGARRRRNSIIPHRSTTEDKWKFFRKQLYKGRACIEQTFGKMERFKRLVLRCEETARNFASIVALACAFTLLKFIHTAHDEEKLPRSVIIVFHSSRAGRHALVKDGEIGPAKEFPRIAVCRPTLGA